MAKSHEVLRRPDADVVEVELGVLEVEVACVTKDDAALGGRSTNTDLKRWHTSRTSSTRRHAAHDIRDGSHAEPVFSHIARASDSILLAPASRPLSGQPLGDDDNGAGIPIPIAEGLIL
jgi:hypothetical protein